MLTFCPRSIRLFRLPPDAQCSVQRLPFSWLSALLALLMLLALQSSPVWAEPVRVDSVQAELIADQAAVSPGSRVKIGLHLVHDEGWHTYWRNPGDSGLATQFPLQLPDGLTAGEIQWPIPQRLLIPPLANLGYEGDVLLVREVDIPDGYDGSTLEVSTLAQWLVCREVCIPGEAQLSLSLPVAPVAQPGPRAPAFAFAASRLPAGQVSVDARISAGKLNLRLPAPAVGAGYKPDNAGQVRLEYFAYTGGVVSHAAPQALGWLADSQAWQLEVPLEPAAPGTAVQQPNAAELAGVVVIDRDRAIEIVAREQAATTAADAQQPGAEAVQPVALIEGHVLPMFEQNNAAGNLLQAAGRQGTGSIAGQLGGFVTGAGATGSSAASVTVPAAPAVSGGSGLQSLWLALVFAAIGGLILNLMPCVFPVIGLKILGFAGSGAGGSVLTPLARRQVRQGSLWFAAGVLVSFIALSGVLLTLRAAGESIGWGFQLQSTVFVVLMALLFVAIGLNFSGVFEFGTSMTRLGNLQAPAPDKDSHGALSAFGAGVLAVLVATPCTAPFMGSALGFTLSQSPLVTLLIFTALGLGMALPYLALGFAPGWLRWLPRPGRWMESLRQFMAFPMYAAAAWLAWVLGLQAGLDAVLALAIGAIVLALALWTWGRHVQSGLGRSRPLAGLISVALVATAIATAWPGPVVPGQYAARQQFVWRDWSARAVADTLAAGQPVLIDFTAAWCISCQVNKKLVLQSDAVTAALIRHNVVGMRADWTQRDPAITAELARHGRNAVPLYLLYQPGGRSPQVLPELLNESVVLEALEAL